MSGGYGFSRNCSLKMKYVSVIDCSVLCGGATGLSEIVLIAGVVVVVTFDLPMCQVSLANAQSRPLEAGEPLAER